jgi:hypothetical protein
MKSSLDKWAKIPKAKRLRATAPAAEPAGADRNERLCPKDGLVLRSYQRDFAGGDKTSDWTDKAWNTDSLWYNAAELKQWLPATSAKGVKYDVPAALVRRFAALNYVDMVRGQTNGYEDAHIEKAELAAEVTGVQKGVVSIKFTGAAKALQKGRWSVRGHEAPQPTDQERGYDFKIVGRASFDGAKNRFVSFELAAVGLRWGGSQYNRRENDLAPAPMGVVIKLADEGDKVAPSGIWRYGWR